MEFFRAGMLLDHRAVDVEVLDRAGGGLQFQDTVNGAAVVVKYCLRYVVSSN